MAEGGDRTTVIVAVAGIAATALVGLAATAASWLSARDDRTTQRSLAREERTYDRRVSAYLDAFDFVEGQKESFDLFRLEFRSTGRTPYHHDPPSRLTSRLRAFGSAQVFTAFQKTESFNEQMPITWGSRTTRRGRTSEYIVGTPWIAQGGQNFDPRFGPAYEAFKAQIVRFETVVHGEIG
jgi:hypothetical protein